MGVGLGPSMWAIKVSVGLRPRPSKCSGLLTRSAGGTAGSPPRGGLSGPHSPPRAPFGLPSPLRPPRRPPRAPVAATGVRESRNSWGGEGGNLPSPILLPLPMLYAPLSRSPGSMVEQRDPPAAAGLRRRVGPGGEGRRRRGGCWVARRVEFHQVPAPARRPDARRGAVRHLLRFPTQIGWARRPVSAPRPGNAEFHARPVRRIYKKGEVKPTAKLESIRFSLQPAITPGAGVYASTWPAVGLIQFELAAGEGLIKSPSNLHQITGRRSAAARRSSGQEVIANPPRLRMVFPD